MRFKPWGGIGDELTATAIVREYKRKFPNEEIHLHDSARADIWKNCPYIRHGVTNNGQDFQPNTYNFPNASTAHGFAKDLGFEIVDDTPEVWLTAEDLAEEFGITNWEKTIAFDAEARWPSRQWRPENFAATILGLQEEGWRVIEVGRRDDGSTHNLTTYKFPRDYSFLNKLKLRQMFALLSKVSLYFGNDSGCFHMAAAVGTPQVVLFGPIKWHQRAYWNTTSLFAYSDCAPGCGQHCSRQERGAYGPVKHCLDEIKPERVLEAVRVAYNRFVVPGLRIARPLAGRSRPIAAPGEPAVKW